MAPNFEAKLARLKAGESPRVLDLFAGCGGLALGFVSAGCVSVGGVELDPDAAKSYAMNFHGWSPAQSDNIHALPKDILKWQPQQLIEGLHRHPHSPNQDVDIIIGGPPCPAFTRIGRAKLREIHQHPEAFKRDPRAMLYKQYLDYVKQLHPLALVMENVPDILNWGGRNLGDDICRELGRMGYLCAYTLLNAANYGVPQLRERFFLIAIHRKADTLPSFPTPSHNAKIPAGYLSSRTVALRNVINHIQEKPHPWYKKPPLASESSPPAVTAYEALADLPPLTDHIQGIDRRGTRRLNGSLPYGSPPQSEYAKFMRAWPRFSSTGYLRDHVTRCLTDRDYNLFARMSPGDDYPKAHALAMKLFHQSLEEHLKNGAPIIKNSRKYLDLLAQIVPPYDPRKFPNKWRKMAAKEPARTLMAHLGKDTYSHIHYDSKQKRVISVREAARLQSFPDGFHFHGTMNPAFRQIGNSVPPLLAWAIADELLLQLGATARVPLPATIKQTAPSETEPMRVA